MSSSHQFTAHLSPSAFEAELRTNILPFWMTRPVDHENGGFYGAIQYNMEIDNTVERPAVLYCRILWTFSKAYQCYQDQSYLHMANDVYGYILKHFWDADFGGVYWSIDCNGNPLQDHKHTYAQAFCIYGFAEYFRATGNHESLQLAQKLFHLVEEHTYDKNYQGNIEGCSRKWQSLKDMRLSMKDMNSAKSMNTLLHLIEAYTNLFRVWPNDLLLQKQKALIRVFIDRVVNAKTNHLNLFFDHAWNSLSDDISFGHDIEASWLLVEAAEVVNDEVLIRMAQNTAIEIAEAVYREGRTNDGSLLYELTSKGIVGEHHWWVQAEAVVGFYNAYQISKKEHYLKAAQSAWQYIQNQFVDRENGDWFKILDKDGKPLPHYKMGPWECPYHHSRLCFEMLARQQSGHL